MKLVSVVVPCYNEQEVLPMFYEEITKISAQMIISHFYFDFKINF